MARRFEVGSFESCTYQKWLGLSLNIGTLSRDILLGLTFLTINEITTNDGARVREEAGDSQAQVPEPESEPVVNEDSS